METYIVLLVVLLLIALFSYTKSGFIDNILLNNYGSCNRENRSYPSGRVPGSYLTLTEPEKKGLFINFVLNDPNKMT